MVGSAISHYNILEKLGEGGMGVVYKAEDTRLKRIVALKFLPPSFSSDREAKERFFHEAQAASALQHNNICVIHDIDETVDGQMFICMELYDGETLKKRIERGPLKIDDAVDIAGQIAQGLARAHEHGIVHRDIKPANIFITSDGSAKILDFGLAKLEGRTMVTREGTTMGTVAYMSPEQVRAEAVDQRTDLWSLGVVLYEMLTGQLPFKGDYDNAVFYGITNADPEPLTGLRTGISPEIERIVLKLLAKDQKERYQHADELLADLRRFRRQSEPSIKLPTGPPPTRPAGPRYIRPLAIAGGLVVILAVAFLVVRPQLEGDLLAANPVPVAVISFVNQTGDHSYDYLQDAIPNLLITNLEQSKYLRVATWERLHDLLEQMGQKNLSVIDRDLGFELCRRDGINAIVLGSYVKAGNVFATDVKVLDVRTKEILKSANSRGEGIESILKSQIDELSREISRGVGLTQRSIDATPLLIQEHSTSSMEAYNYYLRGTIDLSKYYWADALRFLQKSVSIDSNFAAAYLSMGIAHRDLGNTAAAIKAIEKAKSLASRTTRKESLEIEGFYATVVERNLEKGLRVAQTMIEQYPKEKKGYYYRGICLFISKANAEAIKAFKNVLELDPNDGEALNQLSYVYSAMGEFPQAIEYLKRYAAVNPGDANPFDSMGEIYLRMGKLDDAAAQYHEALEVRPDFVSSYMALAYVTSLQENYPAAQQHLDEVFAHTESPGLKAEAYCGKALIHAAMGLFVEARRELAQSEQLAVALGNAELQALCLWSQGWIRYAVGSPDDCSPLFERWYETSSSANRNRNLAFRVGYCFAQGLADLKGNRLDSARTRLAEIREILPAVKSQDLNTAKLGHDLLQAEVWLAGDSSQQALDLLGRISLPAVPALSTIEVGYYNTPNLSDGLARAYQKSGKLSDAIAEYERLTSPGDRGVDRRIIPATYHFLLGKLYEQTGAREKAIERYQKFIRLWKDADRTIPELADAKMRLARLTSKH